MPSKTSIAHLSAEFRDSFPRLLLVLFLSGAMRGYSMPYINLYLTQIGFSGTLIGTLFSVASLIELLLIPALSNMADRTHTHRRMWRGISLSYALACIILIAVPFSAFVYVAVLVLQVNGRSTFVYAMQLAFTKMQQNGRVRFGRVRTTSAGGFMLANITAGAVFALGQYVALFIFAAITAGLSVFFSSALPENTTDKPQTSAPARRSRQFYVLLAAQFFVTMGIRNGFVFWLVHFQENLGIETGQIAIIVAISAVFELPWFFFFDRLQRRSSAIMLYTLGAITFTGLWLAMPLAENFAGIFVLLIVRGMAFGMWNLATLVRIDEISNPRNVSTNQALAQITVPSVAALISGAPMGYLYDTFAPPVFFITCAGMVAIGVVIVGVGSRFAKAKPPQPDAV